ncbi:OsmC family peroxiredoxin [Azospirillum cavernae]|uniref:OsmC family peroxiredoxin n=1 Tax=Azospirillum cavernae TaxID=2320860 RepID=A0A418VRS9_9PROT|nr:OsmC family protein [Azospirillum cavernae]RJF79119.1 OsmC family peroxiredoxin [Azospirillum cavernae]
MTDKTTIATITETGDSPYAVAIAIAGRTLTGDEPVAVGGGDLGPSPFDFLTAALGECTAMTVRWYALQQTWPLEKVEVRIAHFKDGRQDVFEKTIHLTGDSLSSDQRASLMSIAAKCPVQRVLEGTPRITTFEYPTA